MFMILCYLTCQNNSNYIFIMIALYLYSARIKVDTIIFLNYLNLLVLYNIFQAKFQDITSIGK